ARAGELEPWIGRPAAEWFAGRPEPHPDYPGGGRTRTRVVDGACVFLNRRGRGCLLHAFALARGEPVAGLKPLVCSLFPVLFEGGALIVPDEIADRSLVCIGTGPSLYRSARADLEESFGPGLVAELDALEARVLADRPPVRAGTTTSLPVIPV